MWCSTSSSCFSLLNYSCNTTASASTWSQLLFAGRRALSAGVNNSSQILTKSADNNKNQPVRSSSTWKQNSILKNKFDTKKLFSSSTELKANEMEKFTLANKYKGLDYNVW